MIKIKQKSYNRIDYSTLVRIFQMHKSGYSIRKIAKYFSRDKKSISYILSTYRTDKWETMTIHQKASQVTAQVRMNRKRQGRKRIISDQQILNEVRNQLITCRRSPRNASIMIKKTLNKAISASSIYRFTKLPTNQLQDSLFLKGKPRRQRVKCRRSRFSLAAPEKKHITQRDSIIDDRVEFGHFELDTIVSCKNGSNFAILSLTERSTRYKIFRLIPNLQSKTMHSYLRVILKEYSHIIKTITTDNGSEFSTKYTSLLEKEFNGLKIYYCDPYSSFQKGSVERANRDFRLHFPKGTDFINVTKKQVFDVQNTINDTPLVLLMDYSPKQWFDYFYNFYSERKLQA